MRRGTTPYITMQTDQDLTGYSYIVFTIQDRAGTSIDVDNRGGNMQVAPYSVTVKLSQTVPGGYAGFAERRSKNANPGCGYGWERHCVEYHAS